MRFRTLTFLAILVPLGLTALAVFVSVYQNSKGRSAEMGRQLLSAANARAVQQVQSQSKQAADLTRTIASLAAHGLTVDEPDKLLPQLLAILRANPGITWISFSDPAGNFTGVYREAG